MKVLSFEINKQVLEMLRGYIDFQIANGFPSKDRYRAIVNNEVVTFLMQRPQSAPAPPPVPLTSLKSRSFKKFKSPRDFSIVQKKYRKKGLLPCGGEKLNTFHTSSTFGV